MTSAAVIAHSQRTLGGGLGELREALRTAGVTDPLWYEVSKSKLAPKQARRALQEGADLVFVWGGDGMVQRCVDVLSGTPAILAVVPAGTANLLAANLGIPRDIQAAVQIGLHGSRRTLDVGVVNGERFAVMAGTGFDALMIKEANSRLKMRLRRLAYLWTGAKLIFERPVRVRVRVDGKRWFKGKAACVLVGNVGKVLGGISIFDHALPDDGSLDVGVLTAKDLWEWSRAIGRVVIGQAHRSPLMRFTAGQHIDIRLNRKGPYELDGGERAPTRRLRIAVEPGAITVCVPEETSG